MIFSLITCLFFINSAFVKQEIRVLASHVFEMIIFVFMFVLTETMKCLINRSEESADQSRLDEGGSRLVCVCS